MPIREYQAPQGLGLHPSEAGISATVQAARRVQGAFNESAEAQMTLARSIKSTIDVAGDVATKAIDHELISRGARDASKLLLNADTMWAKTANEPGAIEEPNLGAKFLQQLEPELEKFKGAFWTEGSQKWAEQHVESLRNHFTTKVLADQSRMAGEAVSVQHAQTLNNLSTAVRNDPTALDATIGLYQSSIQGLAKSSNLSAVQINHVLTTLQQAGMKELIHSAALGHVALTGEVPEWATSGKYSAFINRQELTGLTAQAKQEQRAQEFYARQARTMEKQEKTDKSNEMVGQFQTKLHDPETGELKIPPTIYRDILNAPEPRRQADGTYSPGLTVAVKGPLLRMIKGLQAEGYAEHDTQGLVSKLLGRVALPSTDPNRLTEAELMGYVGVKDGPALTQRSYGFINSRLRQNSPEERDYTQLLHTKLTQGANLIAPKNGLSAFINQENSAYADNFKARAMEEYDRALRAGKKPADLLSPNSKDYLFTPEFIQQFAPTGTDIITQMRKMNKNYTPRNLNLGGPILGIEVTPAPPLKQSLRDLFGVQ